MNRVAFWLMCVLALSLAGCGDEGAANAPTTGGAKPVGGTTTATKGALGIAAGKIVFQHTGTPSGRVTAWFQDHGATVVLLDETTHVSVKMHTKTIWRDAQTTLHDYVTNKTGTYKARVRATELNWQTETNEKALLAGGHTKLPNETIAGLDCAVWEHAAAGMTTWVHKHLLMKRITNIGGKHYETREAISFEPLDAIPPEVFEVPGS